MKYFDREQIGIDRDVYATLRSLKNPTAIQNYVSSLRYNFEENGETLMSVQETVRAEKAHCIEAALVAACALWIREIPPLVVDMRAKHDTDHVITVYKHDGLWGAISKSNHAVVRYRDPIYRSLRELIISYVHEYYSPEGRRTLRAYSRPFNLTRLSTDVWVTGGKECWEIGAMLDDLPHIDLMDKKTVRNLSMLDSMERKASAITEY